MKSPLTLSSFLVISLFILTGCGNTETTKNALTEETKITVSVVNNAPVATFDTFIINRDVTYNGQLTAVDADADTLTYELVSTCKHGTIRIDKNGCFTYVPQKGYQGKDEFVYRVKDDVSSCPNKKVIIDVTQAPVVKPDAPSNLRLEALSTCKIKVSWQDNSDNETGFEIFRDGKLTAVVDANVITTNICGAMAPATTYKIEVKAKNSAGTSESVRGVVTTKDITTPPTAPSELEVVALEEESVRLVWRDNSNNESSYELYIDGVLKKVISPNCQSTVVTGLEAGKSYRFVIRAKNKIGSSSSKEIVVTTKAPITPDTAPVVTLNGNASEVIVVGDNYTDAGASAFDVEDGNISATCISDVNSSKEGVYNVICRATDSAGHVVSVTRNVKVVTAETLGLKSNIPYDSNLELGGEEGIVYYVDPRPEENGLNRALRIDYLNWTYSELAVNGVNPHSIDRAGESDKFYVRTQNSHSFDVVNFKEATVKTVDMGAHTPRAIGATNLKYNLQLISVRNRQVVDVIDTTTDTIIASLGDETETPGTTTGHALWFDDEHLGLIDRAAPQVVVYKVVDNNGSFDFVETDRVVLPTSLHALERVSHSRTRADLVTFYGNGEGDIAKGGTDVPSVLEFVFHPDSGTLNLGRSVHLADSNATVHGRPPVTHHSGISPDGKYIYVPVFDGEVYIIDRATMQIVKELDAALGAAHIEFSASQNLAIVTNHWSNEVTIIDLKTQTVKKRLIISTTQEFHEETPHLLQPHFSYLSEDGKYYYTLATQDGDFLKINLETLEIEDRLHVGGAPEQAHS